VANKYREKEEAEEQMDAAPKTAPAVRSSRPVKKGVLAKGLSSVFSGSFLTSDKTLKHLPFFLFLAMIAILYIANGYYADDKVREANRLGNELKELRSEYISTKSELMFASKQSEVAKAGAALGLKEPVVPPVKIVVDSNALYSEK
jgi:hypothetical protein